MLLNRTMLTAFAVPEKLSVDIPALIPNPVQVHNYPTANWVSTLDIGGTVYVMPCDGLEAAGLAEQWRRNSVLPGIDWQQIFRTIRHA